MVDDAAKFPRAVIGAGGGGASSSDQLSTATAPSACFGAAAATAAAAVALVGAAIPSPSLSSSLHLSTATAAEFSPTRSPDTDGGRARLRGVGLWARADPPTRGEISATAVAVRFLAPHSTGSVGDTGCVAEISAAAVSVDGDPCNRADRRSPRSGEPTPTAAAIAAAAIAAAAAAVGCAVGAVGAARDRGACAASCNKDQLGSFGAGGENSCRRRCAA